MDYCFLLPTTAVSWQYGTEKESIHSRSYFFSYKVSSDQLSSLELWIQLPQLLSCLLPCTWQLPCILLIYSCISATAYNTDSNSEALLHAPSLVLLFPALYICIEALHDLLSRNLKLAVLIHPFLIKICLPKKKKKRQQDFWI